MVNKEYSILNILRGLSALFVLFYHFFVFFFTNQEMSAGLLGLEPVNLAEPSYLQIFGDFPLNIGHLGVAFFFLISGFLIQPSLERYASLKIYLIHKLFRLWPSYVVCFFMGLLFVILFCILRGSSFPYTSGHLFAYFLWMRDLFHYSFIDGAVWSLEIQVKFYILAGLIWYFGKKNFLEKMCFLTLLTSMVIYGLYTLFNGEEVSWFYLILLVRRNLKYFLLILLGACIHAYSKKQISGQKALGLCSLLLIGFLSPLFSASDASKIVSYLLGFFSFSYFILFKVKGVDSKGLFSKFINWVSDISYPLYIGHVLPGYTMMYFMIEQGLSVYIGIFSALLYVFLMAHVVHKKIEISFINISKKLYIFSGNSLSPAR